MTRPDQPQGRSQKLLPPPVKEMAEIHFPAVPLYQPVKASTEPFAALLKGLSPDLFLVVAYGEILRENLLSIPLFGPINLHTSLLPKYRGAAPIQRALLDGVSETGVTVIKMVRAMDAGEMLGQKKIPVPQDMSFGELEKELLTLSLSLIDEVIEKLQNKTCPAVHQDERQVTFAAKIEPEDREIDWNESPFSIHNRVRAFSPRPGAWSFFDIQGEKKRVKILRTRLVSKDEALLIQESSTRWLAPGKSADVNNFLEILFVQPEGKREMSAADYLRGLTIPPSLFP